MLTEEMVLTALPAGADPERGVARVTCFVTLRLSGQGAQLGETRWAAGWPEALTPALDGMAVEIDTVGTVPASVVSSLPEPALWTAFLPPSTPVEPHEPERWTHRPVATFRGADGARLRARHARTLGSRVAGDRADGDRPDRSARRRQRCVDEPGRHPVAEPVPRRRTALDASTRAPRRPLQRASARPPRRLRRRSARRRLRRGGDPACRRDRRATRGRRGYLPASSPGGANRVQTELARFLVFHHRPEQPPTPLPDAVTLARDLDFHRILTALGAYRFLQRRLGLAVDLEVPLDAVGVDPGRVRIVVPQVDLPIPRLPWTAYALRGPGGDPAFWPAPRPEPVGERVADGLLDLTFRERFSLAQVDVDSAAFKTLSAALAAAAHALLPRPVGTPDADAPPALRSTGLAILHDGRAEALHGRMASSHNLLHRPRRPRSADALRGGRHARLPTRRPRPSPPRVALAACPSRPLRRRRSGSRRARRGRRRRGLRSARPRRARARPPGAPPDPDAAVYLHESIARWEGWSLSAPRPGLGLPPSPHAPTEGEPETQPVPDANPALPDGVPGRGHLPRAARARCRGCGSAASTSCGPARSTSPATARRSRRPTRCSPLRAAGTSAPVLPVQRRVFAFERFDPLARPRAGARAEQ